MLRVLLPSLFIACCAVSGGAAEPVVDGPSYATAEKQAFWYATILDWTFTSDVYTPNSLPSNLMPKRLVEVALWRGQVHETSAGPRWSAENWLTWTRKGPPQFEVESRMTVPLPRAKVTLTYPTIIGACPYFPGSGDVVIDLASGAPVGYRMRMDDDFSTVLVGLGIPDLAIGQRPGPGVVRSVLPDRTPGWSWSDPQLNRTLDQLNLGQLDVGGMKLDLTMQVEVLGTASGQLIWNPGAGRPQSATVAADVGLVLKPAIAKPLPKEAKAPEVRGRLILSRQAWVLPDSAKLEIPRDLPRLLQGLAAQAWIDGKPMPWADLARSTDADLAAVAAGVVQAAAHPPVVGTERAARAP